MKQYGKERKCPCGKKDVNEKNVEVTLFANMEKGSNYVQSMVSEFKM